MQGSDLEGQFEFVPHTADIAARLRGPTLPALFEAAAAAFAEALTDRTEVRATAERRVELAARDLEQLLVDWLEELLFLFETEAFLPCETDVTITYGSTKATKATREGCETDSLSGTPEDLRDLRGLRELRDDYVIVGTLRGEPRDASRHPLKLLIKAVTYHGLQVVETDDGYEATVIFDI